jgi:tRNA-2-methylthio-N6-dimethylallyladenosine synthase
MNEHDSEKVRGLLLHQGLIPAASPDQAELFLVNTCSVREKAVQKVYSRLGEFKKRKSQDPRFLLGVLGCVAQQEGEQMVNSAPFVDLVVGTHQYDTIPDLVDAAAARAKAAKPGVVSTALSRQKSLAEMPLIDRGNSFRAAITIMEGCNKHCAFCIVPFTRGRERNRSHRAILGEIRQAVDAGYVEIQLLGQTVNSYKDPERPAYKFPELLADVAAIDGVLRIRFTSPHPRHFTDEVLAILAEHENICNHVHLPVQSGSSRMLRRMRRQHDREWYLALVEKFRALPRAFALSTDMIVGFPGETEEDFQETLSLVEWVGYEQMFSFKYSPRPFTEASGWEDDVPEADKSRRLTILQRCQRCIQMELHERLYVGGTFEVLVEGQARDGQRFFGRTTTNTVVNFTGVASPGEFRHVRVTAAGPNSVVGELVGRDEPI